MDSGFEWVRTDLCSLWIRFDGFSICKNGEEREATQKTKVRTHIRKTTQPRINRMGCTIKSFTTKKQEGARNILQSTDWECLM